MFTTLKNKLTELLAGKVNIVSQETPVAASIVASQADKDAAERLLKKLARIPPKPPKRPWVEGEFETTSERMLRMLQEIDPSHLKTDEHRERLAKSIEEAQLDVDDDFMGEFDRWTHSVANVMNLLDPFYESTGLLASIRSEHERADINVKFEIQQYESFKVPSSVVNEGMRLRKLVRDAGYCSNLRGENKKDAALFMAWIKDTKGSVAEEINQRQVECSVWHCTRRDIYMKKNKLATFQGYDFHSEENKFRG